MNFEIRSKKKITNIYSAQFTHLLRYQNDGLMITVPRDYNESNAMAFKIIPKEKK